MKTYSCPYVFNKAPHLSRLCDKAQYMCPVNKLLQEWALENYRPWSCSNVQPILVSQAGSWVWFIKPGCHMIRSEKGFVVRRGAEGIQWLITLALLAIILSEQKRVRGAGARQHGQTKYLQNKEIQDLFSVCCERCINNQDFLYVCWGKRVHFLPSKKNSVWHMVVQSNA